jgi:hypothetical protein
MAKKEQAAPAFKLGDYVRIRYSRFPPARVVELRGPLAPGGVQVYRVRIRETRPPTYIEVREDQMELVPAPSCPALKLGDSVRILHTEWPPGRIVKERGPLGPGGAPVDRVRIGVKPRPIYVELLAEQMELVRAAE